MVSSVSHPRIERRDEGTFLLSGDLSFASVPALLRESQHLLPQQIAAADANAVTIDLQGVSRTDSAGLALLVEWTRNFRAQGITLHFLNIPTQMLALAHLSGLEGVLSLPNTA